MTANTDTSTGTLQHVRVLIADDDARVRRALRALVESDPAISVVGEACCAREVLEYDRALQPTVILLDVVTPGLDDGLGALRQLAQIEKRTVVAMSLRAGLRNAALAVGARAFIDRGGAPDALLAALHAALIAAPATA